MVNSWDSFGTKFIHSSIVGAARGLIGLPLEQPFDRVKTYWQAHPQIPSVSKVTQIIYRTEGLAGFYRGGIPNGIRLCSKQIYRFPIILAIPSLYSNHIPPHVKKQYPSLEPIITGIMLSTFETFFITPLESAKVWLMTNQDKNKRLSHFLNQKDVFNYLYRGWRPTYFKVTASWLSFLISNDKFKELARTYNPNRKELSFLSLFLVSIGVGGVNTLAVMPFDVVKTALQKADSHGSQKVVQTMIDLVKNHKFLVLYRGWQIKFAHSVLQAAFTVPLLDFVQQQWRKQKK